MFLKDVCAYAYVYFSCGLKAAEIHSFTVLEARNLESRRPHCHTSSEGSVGESDFLFPTSDNILIEGIIVNVTTLNKNRFKSPTWCQFLKKDHQPNPK